MHELIRTFVAVEIPTIPGLTGLMDALRRSDARISVPRSEGIHVTLKFLGDIPESSVDGILEILGRCIVAHRRFEVEVIGTGAFPNVRNPRVLWAGLMDTGGLSALAGSVNNGLSEIGFEMDRREFRPHVTLARVKSLSGIERALALMRDHENTRFGSFWVDDVRFKKSTLTPSGAIYENLGVILLAGEDTCHEEDR